MNTHSPIGDSDVSVESSVVGPQTNANQTGSFSSAGASTAESLPAGAIPCQEGSDEPKKWLAIEHVAPSTLDEVIKQTLVRLLRETRGNRRRTASVLGISRSTLYRMLDRYAIGHVGRDAASSRKTRVNRAGPRAVPPVPKA